MNDKVERKWGYHQATEILNDKGQQQKADFVRLVWYFADTDIHTRISRC